MAPTEQQILDKLAAAQAAALLGDVDAAAKYANEALALRRQTTEIPPVGTPEWEAFNEGDYDARWGRVPNPNKYADEALQVAYERGHRAFDVKAYLAGFDREPLGRERESEESYRGTENYR